MSAFYNKDNLRQNTKGYLLHQIHFKSKHPKILV